jgi:hypothetical protein
VSKLILEAFSRQDVCGPSLPKGRRCPDGDFLCLRFLVDFADATQATAMVSFIISLGEAFGVGIGGVVFQNEWNRHIERAILSEIMAPEFVLSYKEAEQAASLIELFPVYIQTLYRVIMADVIEALFIVLAVFSGAAFLASLVSRDLSMDRETRSSQQFQEKKRIKTGSP